MGDLRVETSGVAQQPRCSEPVGDCVPKRSGNTRADIYVQGLITPLSNGKSVPFRVTNFRSWTSAVVTKKASITPIGRPAASWRDTDLPHASATWLPIARKTPR